MNLKNNITTDIINHITSAKNEMNTWLETVEQEKYNQKPLSFTEVTSSDIPEFPELSAEDHKILIPLV